jgi:hypothetical protein
VDKITHLEEYFPTGERTVQPVLLWANGRPCYEEITKTASVGREFFRDITPVPGHTFVYVLAVSSWERYGENRNGDAFPELPYKEDCDPAWIAPGDILTQHYKTFEAFGKNYRHHVNKDPKKSVGDVVKAFWNAPMHRVELLIDLHDEKAPDLAQRIADGEFPPVSMGTKVPYDVCTICGNRAPTRAHYCDHLKFKMRDVINDVKVAALNPRPKFFDISWVFRGADPNAMMLKKVAYDAPYVLTGVDAGEYVDDMAHYKAAAHKMAVIDKVVQGIPMDAKRVGMAEPELTSMCQMRDAVLDAGSRAPVIPDDVLGELSKHPLSKILSTSGASGMMLSTPEFTKIIIKKRAPKTQVLDSDLDKMLLLQRPIMELFEDAPQLLKQIEESGAFDVSPKDVDTKVAQLLEPYMEKRSGIQEYLKRQLVPEDYRDQVARSTPFTLTDPATGIAYGTTRGAAIKAHDEIAKRNLYKVLGGAALLGGAYRILGQGLTRRGAGKLKPLLGLTLAGLGASQWPDMGPHYMTEQGVPVPTMTEITPLKYASGAMSVALPALGTLGAMTAMSHDYMSRVNQGIPVGHPALPASRRYLDKLEQAVSEHPVASAILGTLLLRRVGKSSIGRGISKRVLDPAGRGISKAHEKAKAALKAFGGGSEKISSWLGEEVLGQETDTVLLPEVDLDKVAELLGEVIVES